MKIATDTNEAILSNVGTAGEFKIRNSAKAFKILSDGLYSNKIRAIIRELSCNAVDSHVAAGKANVPFEVHLPVFLEPWFSVKDFGLGLNRDQVVNIYTTYFESTKTDSNDFIGALGLGSKSPFSYTENFTVTAIKDGYKRIYSAFINEVGVPSIVEMSEELTDEGNGVEVKFSVTNKYDYQSFQNEARHVFTWFSLKPVITGATSFAFHELEFKEKNIVPGVHTMPDNNNHSVAVMGNISYPLGNISEPEKHFGDLAPFLRCGLVMEFKIGELDFAASREELSYVPVTINSIKKKLEALGANLQKHLATKADAIQNDWHRAEFLYAQARSQLFGDAVKRYVRETGFALFDDKVYHGRKDFIFKVEDLVKDGIQIDGFRTTHNGCQKVGSYNEYIGTSYARVSKIPVDPKVVIVLNDLKTGCISRARYHYSNTPDSISVFCISYDYPDLEARQVVYDKFITDLHNPPTVVMASTLNKRPSQRNLSKQGILEIGLKQNKYRGNSESYTWVRYDGQFDENETYYYVTLNNHTPYNDAGEIDMFKIKSYMDECGVGDISKIKVFGVRKNRLKEFKDLDNWIWFEDKLKEETAKISDNEVKSLVIGEMLDSYNNRLYTNANVAKLVGPDSDYAKYVVEYLNIARKTGNVVALVTLCGMYGKSVQVEAVKEKIETDKAAILKKYSMLKHVDRDANVAEVAEYIKMVDKMEKLK
jgi:hypothetical protein